MLVFKRSFSVARMAQRNIGFIGLGRMGLNMAKNLEKKMGPDDNLYVYDVNESVMQKFDGPRTFQAKDVAEDTTVTMLPESKHVRKVYGEIARSAYDAQKFFIDSSTIDVQTSIETAKLLRTNKIGQFVDAPVSGGVAGATNGTLTFMVGAVDLKPVQPILEMMGKRIVSCGEAGSGISAKLCNNYLLALNNIATAEAFQLARELGLDMNVVTEIINTSTGKCWPSDVNNPVPGIDPNTPSSNDYNGGFALELMKKDFNLALDAAKLSQCPLPMSERAAEVYEAVSKDELSKGKDMSVIYRWLGSQKESG